MRCFSKQLGFSVLGALVGIALLAALGSSLTVLVGANQRTRIQATQSLQSFYATQAGLEVALGLGHADNTWTSLTRQINFGGTNTVNIVVTRASGKINVTTTAGDSTSAFSITDPNPPPLPPTPNCLVVDTSAAQVNPEKKLVGIVLRKHASCAQVVIQSMEVTWVPNLGEELNQIKIDGHVVFGSGTAHSGDLINIDDVSISDTNDHPLDFILWQQNIENHNLILKFNLSDGTSQTVSLTLLENCLVVNTSAAELVKNDGKWEQLRGLTVQNGDSCTKPLRIDALTTHWLPTTPARHLEKIRIHGNTLFNGSKDSGQEADIDQVIPVSTTYDVNYLEFDDEMLGRNYTLDWKLVDGTVLNTTLNLFAANQNTCLTVDTSAVTRTGKKLQGITLQNTCGSDVGITGLTLTWSGGVAGQKVKEIRIHSTTVFTGTSNSGQKSDFGDKDVYFRNENTADDPNPRALNTIEFKENVDPNIAYTLDFEMSDGSTKNAVVSATQAASFTYDKTAVVFDNPKVNLMGLTLGNNGASAITLNTITVNWSGVPPNRRLTNIYIPTATEVFSGSLPKNNVADITNTALTAGSSGVTTKFTFNQNMQSSAGNIDVMFTFTDGSTATVENLPPDDDDEDEDD